jgi:hypothetical protein
MPKSSPRRNAAEGEKRRFRQLFRSKNAARPGLTRGALGLEQMSPQKSDGISGRLRGNRRIKNHGVARRLRHARAEGAGVERRQLAIDEQRGPP